ncbi:Phosphatidylinositol 5-phosphate 4-kinase type-2 alpha [Actinomortierella ambigua]|nr:Phosphatidylinositol 5-phosphate 4-kinase type-2 alpha [Actinomortierella ambigua]
MLAKPSQQQQQHIVEPKSVTEPTIAINRTASKAVPSLQEPPVVTTATAITTAAAITEVVSIQEQTTTTANRSSTTSSLSQRSTVEGSSEGSTRPSSSSTDAAQQELSLLGPSSPLLPPPPPLPPKDTMMMVENSKAPSDPQQQRQRQPQKQSPQKKQQQEEEQEQELEQEKDGQDDDNDDAESLAAEQDFESVTTSDSPTSSNRAGLRPRHLWSKVRHVVRVPDFSFGRKRPSGAITSLYQLGNGAANGVVGAGAGSRGSGGGKVVSISDTHLPYNRNAAFSFQLESAANSTVDLTAAAGIAEDGCTDASMGTSGLDGGLPMSSSLPWQQPQQQLSKPVPPPPLMTDGLYLGWPGGSQRRISTVFETPPETADNSRVGSAIDIRSPSAPLSKPPPYDTGDHEDRSLHQQQPYQHHHLFLPGISRKTSTKARAIAAETTTTIETKVSLASLNECPQSSSVSITTISSANDQETYGDSKGTEREGDGDGAEKSIIQLQIQSPTSPATVEPLPEPPRASLLSVAEGSGKDARLDDRGGGGGSPRPQRGNTLDVPSSPVALPWITRKQRAMSVGQDLESYLSTRSPASTSTSNYLNQQGVGQGGMIERHYRQPSGQISGPPPSAGLDALKRLSRELAVSGASSAHDRSPSCPVSPRNSVVDVGAPLWPPPKEDEGSAPPPPPLPQNHRKDASSSYPLPNLPSKEERRLSALSFGGYFSSYGSGTSGPTLPQNQQQQQQQQSASWQSGSRMIPSLSSLALPSLPSFSPPKSDTLQSGALGLARSTTTARISDATIHQEGRPPVQHGIYDTGAASVSSGTGAGGGSGAPLLARKLPPPLRISGSGLHGHISAPSPILPPTSSSFAFGGHGQHLHQPHQHHQHHNGVGGVNNKMMTPMMMVSMMLSNRQMIPRLPISLDKYYYGVDQVHEWRIPSYGRVRFIDHAPQVFRVIRQRFGYELSDLDEALAEPFTVMTTPGKSDAIFFASHNNGRFLLKTLRGAEPENLKQLLPDYVEHLQKHPNTLLPRYLGMFTFERLGGLGKSTAVAQDGDTMDHGGSGAVGAGGVGTGGPGVGAGAGAGVGAASTSHHQRGTSHRRPEPASTSHSTAKHLHMNGTLLTGLGRDDCLPSKVIVVVIANVFDTSSVVHERYDFKGSNVGRRTLSDFPPPPPAAAAAATTTTTTTNPVAVMDPTMTARANHDTTLASDAGPSRRWSTHSATGPTVATPAPVDNASSQARADISHLTLKEVDFQNRVMAGETQRIHLGPFMRQELLRQLEEDTLLLRKHGFMDYSMLVGIHIVPKKQPDPVMEAPPETRDNTLPQEGADALSEQAREKDDTGSLHTAESDDGEDEEEEEEEDEDEEEPAGDPENDPPTALVTLLETLQAHLHTSYEYLTHTQQTAQEKVAEFWNAHKDLPWVQDLMSNAEATREWLQETSEKKKNKKSPKKKVIDGSSPGMDGQDEQHRGSGKGKKSHRRSRRHATQQQQQQIEEGGEGFQTPSTSRTGTLRKHVGGRSNQFSTVRAHGNPWPVNEEEGEEEEEAATEKEPDQIKLASALAAAMTMANDAERQISDPTEGETKGPATTASTLAHDLASEVSGAPPMSGAAPSILPQTHLPPLQQSQQQRPIWSSGVPGMDFPDGTEVIYFFGLIDILQKYNLVKWLERNIKGANVRLLGSSPPNVGIIGGGRGGGGGAPPQPSAFHHLKEPSATGISGLWGGGGGGHHDTNHTGLGSLSRLLPSASASESSLPLALAGAAGGASSSPMHGGGLSRSTSRTALGASAAPPHHQYHHSRRTTGNLSTATQTSFMSEKDEGNGGGGGGGGSTRIPASSDMVMAETVTATTAAPVHPHPHPLGTPVVQPPTPTVASPYPHAAPFSQQWEVSVEEPGRYAERLVDYIRGATL